jgi:hypothetical protein
MEIQQTSFKMMILLRYSSYRNYLLRYMCINFLGNRPQADGEWQKLHSHVYTHVTVCSFVSFTYYLIYLRRWIAKKIRLWCCLFTREAENPCMSKWQCMESMQSIMWLFY